MTALEAQGKAARAVRELRDLAANFGCLVDSMHRCDRELRALQPSLTPADSAEIDAELDRISTRMAAAFTSALNPAEESA